MSRVITATGMALLSIGIVTAVHAKPASQAGHVKVDEAAQADGQIGEDDVATARSKGPKLRDKVDKVRHRGGPKGGGRDKVDTGRAEGPAPIDTTAEVRRREGPKGDGGHGVTEVDEAAEPQPMERRREGPKGDVDHGLAEVDEAAEAQPMEQRREGPKGAGESGLTEVDETAEAQLVKRREGPKGDEGSGLAASPIALGNEAMAEKKRGPKERDKIDTGLTGAPSTDAARTGRPKERDKTPMDTSRVSDPAASTDPQPVAKKRHGPKIKSKTATND